jgi:hypothetical protein
VGVTKNFEGGWQAAVAYVDTNADKNFYTICDTAGGVSTRCKDTGDSKWLIYVKRTF